MPEGPKGKRPSSPRGDIAAWQKRPVRKHLNAAERRAIKAAAIQHFAKKVARKAQKNTEPNDRKYNRETERAVGRMRAEDFDSLLRDGEEDA